MATITTESLQNQLKELQLKNYKKLMASLKIIYSGKTEEDIISFYVEQADGIVKAAKEAAKAEKAAKKAAKKQTH